MSKFEPTPLPKAAPTREPLRPPTPVGRPRNRAALVLLSLAALAFGIGTLYAALAIRHASVAATGVMFGSVDVGGQDKTQLAETVVTLAQAAQVRVTYEDRSVLAGLADLGVTVDVDATVDAALRATPGSLVGGQAGRSTTAVPFTVTVDQARLRAWTAARFPMDVDAPAAPVIRYDDAAGAFTVTPGHSGWDYDFAPVLAAIAEAAADPGTTAAASLRLQPAGPAIPDQAATSAAEAANRRLGLTLEFTTSGGASYTATAADIAAWTQLVADETAARVDLLYDPVTIAAGLRAVLAPAFEQAGEPRRSAQTADGRDLGEFDPGTPGAALGDLTQTAVTVAEMLERGTNVVVTVPLTLSAPATIVTALSGPAPVAGQWIDVDLTTQVTLLMEGDTLVRGFVISSGKSDTPTPLGTFAVYAKVAIQTMSGYNADG
ncbi:MAG: L,D-transpeptidase/peptidoglycan binding protein, partial [Propionibacteriaceae bacterium]|nr:L,D-transpeptidase/peptidoglycan binding protein [Propionibacteriaceae bacterium]